MAADTASEAPKKADARAGGQKLHVDRKKMVVGSVVWVLVRGYPWWPAVIRNSKTTRAALNDTDRNQLPPDGVDTRVVEFFNDENKIYVVPLKDMRTYKKDDMSLLGKVEPGYRTTVAQACDEADTFIRLAAEAPQKRGFGGNHRRATGNDPIEKDLDKIVASEWRDDRIRSSPSRRPPPAHSASSTLRTSRPRRANSSAGRLSRVASPSDAQPDGSNEANDVPMEDDPGPDTNGHPPWTTPLSAAVQFDSPEPASGRSKRNKPSMDQLPMKLRLREQRKKRRVSNEDSPTRKEDANTQVDEDRRSEHTKQSDAEQAKETTNASGDGEDNGETRQTREDEAMVPSEEVETADMDTATQDDIVLGNDETDDRMAVDSPPNMDDESIGSLATKSRAKRQRSVESSPVMSPSRNSVVSNDEDDDELDLEHSSEDMRILTKNADAVKEFIGALQRVKRELKDTMRQAARKKEEIASLEEQRIDAERQVKNAREDEKHVKGIVRSMETRMNHLTASIKNGREEFDESVQKNRRVLGEQQKEIETGRKQIESQQKDIEKQKKLIAGYQKEASRLKSRVVGLQRKEASLKGQRNELSKSASTNGEKAGGSTS